MACARGETCDRCGGSAAATFFYPAFVIQLCAHCAAIVLDDGALARATFIDPIGEPCEKS